MKHLLLKTISLNSARYLLLTAILSIVHISASAQTSVLGGTTSQSYSLVATAVVVDPAIVITSGTNIDGFRVTISTGFKSADELSYTGSLPSGISASYSSSTGILTFTGSTSAADWQTLLRTVTYRNLNSAQFGNRTITFSAGTLSAFTNGHFYELVSTTANWSTAKTAAEARSYLGLGGYLATSTSADENAYIRQTLSADAWIGGTDNFTTINTAVGSSLYANQAAAEGRWTWVTGPEKGTLFSVGNGSPVTQAGQYANWNTGEPNNSSQEHVLQIYSSSGSAGRWNDLRTTNTLGYVVEYGGLATDPVQTISSNTSIAIAISDNTISSSQTVCDGSTPSSLIGSTPTGGNGSYTYQWIASTTSATAGFSNATGSSTSIDYSPSSLSNTTWFKRIVTSGVEVDTSAAVEITLNAAITIGSTTTNINCNGDATGSISVTPSGGGGSFTYAWSNGGSSSSISALVASSYTVTVTDANTCTKSSSFTLTQPSALSASTSQSNNACNGYSLGAASVTVSGGVAPYTYLWSTGSTSSLITLRPAGTYTCTTTDANSCVLNTTFTITEPAALTATTSQVNALCNGSSDGSATVIPAGGTAPYTYLWSIGGTAATRTGLFASTFTCTVTDNNGCVTQPSVTITHPNGFGLGAGTTPVSCNGGSDGTATLNVTGGTTPYTYLWSNGNTGVTATNLSAATYTCSVTDNNGCTTSRTVSISQPSVLQVNGSAIATSCNGNATGRVLQALSGGNTPYTYAWSNGATTINATNLAAGTYTCTVTDSKGCTTINSYVITQPTAIVITPSQTNLLCNGFSNGSATVSASGGTPGYTYFWSGGGSSATKSSLVAGNYTCTIQDANGCTTSQNFTITEPTALSIIGSQTNASCNGGSNATAEVNVSGGTPGYTYLWTGGETTSTVSSLSAGTYTCAIQDANLCPVATETFIITEPSLLSITPSQTNITCNGLSDATAEVTVSGGTPGYTYLWNSGATTSSISSLIAGTYFCAIQDANLCPVVVEFFTITEPSALTTSATSTDAICHGSSTGEVDLTTSGGTGNYTYLWSNGATTADLTAVDAGTYTVTVTDDALCVASTSIDVLQPAQIIPGIFHTDATCFGGNGSAYSLAYGGTGTLTYQWSSGGTSDTEIDLPAGLYSCTITDSLGCNNNESFTIDEPTQITSWILAIDPNCFGGEGNATVFPSGGVGNFSYLWSTGGTADFESNLLAGQYTVTITDGNGCTAIDTTTIIDPPSISSTYTGGTTSCFASTDASVTVTAADGVAPYSYLWSTGGTTDTENGLSAGNYTLTITDDNGCEYTTTVTVNEPALLQANTTATDATCNGDSNGSAITAVNGGTAPYSYLWNNGNTSSDNLNLTAQTTTVTVTDNNGCEATETVTINEPTALSISANVINETTGNDGQIDVSVIGGTSGYTYLWNNGSTTEDLTALTAGDYTITITDANNCSTSSTFTVSSFVGIDQIDGSSTMIEIFPNPNNGNFNLKTNQAGVYRLIDELGKLVKEVRLNKDNNFTTSLNNLSSGVYYLQSLESTNRLNKKIVVIK